MKTNCGSSPDSITKVTMKEQPKSRELNEYLWDLYQTTSRKEAGDKIRNILASISRVSGEPPKPDELITNEGLMKLGYAYYHNKTDGIMTRDFPGGLDIDWVDGKIQVKSHYENGDMYRPLHNIKTIKQLQNLIDGFEKVSGEAKTEEQLEMLFKTKFVTNMRVNNFEAFKRTYSTLWYKVILPTLKQLSNVE